jgi:uncharacterized damage-inducible protein DinB
MDAVRHYQQLFCYDDWANREILAILKAHKGSPVRSLELLAHILSAERLWLERINHAPQSLPVWPRFTVEECVQHVEEMALLWKEFLSRKNEEDLAGLVHYKNTKGEIFNSRIDDILTHVVTHSAHHRGQIAADMRAAGMTPAYTDFIHGVRQGHVK